MFAEFFGDLNKLGEMANLVSDELESDCLG